MRLVLIIYDSRSWKYSQDLCSLESDYSIIFEKSG